MPDISASSQAKLQNVTRSVSRLQNQLGPPCISFCSDGDLDSSQTEDSNTCQVAPDFSFVPEGEAGISKSSLPEHIYLS